MLANRGCVPVELASAVEGKRAVCRLPLEGGGPNAMGLARSAQTLEQRRGRANSLAFGVGVSDASVARASVTPTHLDFKWGARPAGGNIPRKQRQMTYALRSQIMARLPPPLRAFGTRGRRPKIRQLACKPGSVRRTCSV